MQQNNKQDVPLTFIRRCFLVGYGCLDVASTLLFDVVLPLKSDVKAMFHLQP